MAKPTPIRHFHPVALALIGVIQTVVFLATWRLADLEQAIWAQVVVGIFLGVYWLYVHNTTEPRTSSSSTTGLVEGLDCD